MNRGHVRHVSGFAPAASSQPSGEGHQSLTLEELALLGVLSTCRSHQITVEIINGQRGPRATAARSLADRNLIDWLGCAGSVVGDRRTLRIRYGLSASGERLLASLCETTVRRKEA